MYRKIFVLFVVVAFIICETTEAQRRGGGRSGGRSGGGRSGGGRSMSRSSPSMSRSSQFGGSRSSNRMQSNNFSRGNSSRGNFNSGNFGSGSFGSGSRGNFNSGNFGSTNRGNFNSGGLASGNRSNFGSGNFGSGNFGSGNFGSGNFGSGNLGANNRGSGNLGANNRGSGALGNRSNMTSGNQRLDSFLNSSGTSSGRNTQSNRMANKDGSGQGWNSKTFETAKGGTITVGRGSGSKTGDGGSQVGAAGRGVSIETAGGKTLSKGSLTGGATDGQGNARAGRVTGGKVADGSGNSAGGARGAQVDSHGNFQRGSVRGAQNSQGYAKVTGRGVSGNLNTGNRNVRAGGAVRGPYGNTITAGRGASFVNGQFVGGRTWTAVNGNFTRWNYFGSNYWRRYPGAWVPQRWVYGGVWWWSTWADTAAYCGFEEPGVYYDYGQNVTYDNENVYFENERITTTESFYAKAKLIAEAGKESTNDEWLPLGVFAFVKNSDQSDTERVFQLAINKDRAIRGNMHDMLTEKATPLYGAADKNTQRVGIMMDGNDEVVLEVGLYNLTNDEVPILIHFSKDKRQDAMLIRLKNPEEKPEEKKDKQ